MVSENAPALFVLIVSPTLGSSTVYPIVSWMLSAQQI